MTDLHNTGPPRRHTELAYEIAYFFTASDDGGTHGPGSTA